MAYTLRYAEELRKAEDYFSGIAPVEIDKKQLAMAADLVKAYTAPFKFEEYKDDYEAALRELIEAKEKHMPLPLEEEEPAQPRTMGLMDALRRSLEGTHQPRPRTQKTAGRRKAGCCRAARPSAGEASEAPAQGRLKWLRKRNPARSAAQTVARQLERYREMRDFHVTAEPRGGRRSAPSSQTLPFVIQKHAATRLHYDFRLGWHGVLKSWAVTKGPSYFPADRRLAVQVEDHPMEYGGFEGTIPKGQYGGGTVMVWDYGEWKPLGDVDSGLADGHLKFELDGKKLKGRWALVRMHGPREHADKAQLAAHQGS